MSGETAKRIACDAIARIGVVGDRGDGIVDVLHMGRAFRTTTVAQRKALELQDGGCIWCGKHPRSCTPITGWRGVRAAGPTMRTSASFAGSTTSRSMRVATAQRR